MTLQARRPRRKAKALLAQQKALTATEKRIKEERRNSSPSLMSSRSRSNSSGSAWTISPPRRRRWSPKWTRDSERSMRVNGDKKKIAALKKDKADFQDRLGKIETILADIGGLISEAGSEEELKWLGGRDSNSHHVIL